MTRKKFWLIAAAAMALPAVAWAGRPAARDVIVIPAGFAPPPMPLIQPVLLPMPVQPGGLFREVALLQNQMQASMAALQRFAVQPIALPPGGTDFTRISMVSISGPDAVCGETMTVVPGPNGKPVVTVRRIGKGCAPMPAALPRAMPAPAQAAPHLPPNALPPPSKLIYAKYRIPPKEPAPIRQG